MEVVSRNRLMLFSGRASTELAAEVAELMAVRVGALQISPFANGEIYVRPTESVRGADCFVMQSHSYPVNEHIMEQLILIDALRRASARRITAVMPSFGYARQDKKAKPREPITARLIGDLFMAAGADRLVSVDLHSGQLQGFVPRFDHLTAIPLITDYLRENIDGPTTIVSPDAGGVKRAEKYAVRLDADEVAFVYKRRDPDMHNVSQATRLSGEVEGNHVVIVDDMIDTAGTVINAAELSREFGAVSVRIAATHGIFSDPAIDRLKNAAIDEVVVTNTLPVPPDVAAFENVKILSVAPILAEALTAIFMDSSVSEIFLGDNT